MKLFCSSCTPEVEISPCLVHPRSYSISCRCECFSFFSYWQMSRKDRYHNFLVDCTPLLPKYWTFLSVISFGDKDLDMRLSNPLHLRSVLEDARYSKSRIVLLHASYPFSREASYLASVYPQANIYNSVACISIFKFGSHVHWQVTQSPHSGLPWFWVGNSKA